MLAHKGTKEIDTKRLKLRKYTLLDAASMYKNYAADERVARFLSWKPYKSIEEVEAFLSDMIGKYECKDVYHWAIEMNREVIGSISTISIDEKNCNCELGYCIGYDYWNKGIATEAMLAVMNFLFNEVGMHRITAKHDVENPASGRVMQKCNMTYEGKLRGHYLRHDGTYSDALVYGIIKNEFRHIF
ncbi:GNAT family N-acetyltransferase [Acetivibrio straminisolvens]|jgi:ribosomal-protein-alanine N-acetyltransferase|uniref:Acetyltransferase n=1 Tax=Acetivibrio straminisolvens JCM 21531 TaxID=1294263 RepID=W4V2F4_9FIRM|nr:GNAT family N-acetyltransferase [Acetivibrio straminisolvens]GAE86983.1 acetyltransferase [Acetivibrio straminisolvens JCM 21531]